MIRGMLPFGKKSHEVKKFHTFLQEQDVLKSGQLQKLEYDSNDDELKSLLKKELGAGYTPKQTASILSILRKCKGKVRAFERTMQIRFVSFYDLEDHPEDIPEELDYFTTWYLDHFIAIQQTERKWWDWNAFANAMLGVAVVAAGAVMIVLTAKIKKYDGQAIIVSGLTDMVYSTCAGLHGTFTWKDYSIQKTIGLTLAVATGGLGTRAEQLKYATKVGSASRFSPFLKAAAEATGYFVKNAAVNIQPDTVLANIEGQMADSIVNYIAGKLFPLLKTKIKSRLIAVSMEAGGKIETFRKRSTQILVDTQKKLETSSFSTIMDQIQSVLTYLLTQKCPEQIAMNTPQSGLGIGAKVAFFVKCIFSVVRGTVRITQTAYDLVNLLVTTNQEISNPSVNKDIDMRAVEEELNKIESCIKEFISKQLQERIKSVLRKTLEIMLKKITLSTTRLLNISVKRSFSEKKTSQLVKEINAKVSKLCRENSTNTTDENELIPQASTNENKRDRFQETIIKPERLLTTSSSTGSSSGVLDETENQSLDSPDQVPPVQVATIRSIIEAHVQRKANSTMDDDCKSRSLDNVPVIEGYYPLSCTSIFN